MLLISTCVEVRSSWWRWKGLGKRKSGCAPTSALPHTFRSRPRLVPLTSRVCCRPCDPGKLQLVNNQCRVKPQMSTTTSDVPWIGRAVGQTRCHAFMVKLRNWIFLPVWNRTPEAQVEALGSREQLARVPCPKPMRCPWRTRCGHQMGDRKEDAVTSASVWVRRPSKPTAISLSSCSDSDLMVAVVIRHCRSRPCASRANGVSLRQEPSHCMCSCSTAMFHAVTVALGSGEWRV